jgi:3-dehydroquinate dehydratase/shikimate dehydrogenase
VNNGKICIPVGAATAGELIEKIVRAERSADIVEVRMDHLERAELAHFRSQISKLKFERLLIATFRSFEQGGLTSESLDDRAAFWSEPIDGFWGADVEEDVIDSSDAWPHRIVSFHDHDGHAAELRSLFEHLCRYDAEAVKLAVTVDDATDAIPVWKLIEAADRQNKNIIPIAMGDAGKWTRILGLADGAFLTYASLDEASATASGQLTVDDMLSVYRVKELDRDTKVYGVIGDPVSESLSPYIHNAAFADAGLNSVFIPLQVKDVDAFFKRMILPATREVELNFAGFAVTMPHKQAVMKYLDAIDATAERIGAINTIVIETERLRGYNTDVTGFIKPLKTHIPNLRGMRAAVLGTGGAARACVDALDQEQAAVTVFARDIDKAAAFASRPWVTVNSISDLRSEISNFDVLVNATPLGMKGEFEAVSPLAADELKGVRLVFDLVTRPKDTPLIREARIAGVTAVAGVEMLIEQAAQQFEIWTSRETPGGIMRRAALERMEKMR